MKQFNNMPNHIAIIMDGNRRWARERGLSPIAGHQYVADHILEPLIEHAAKLGIKYVTLWAFSTENWSREPTEVKGIMTILRRSLQIFGTKMHQKGIRIKTIGDLSRFHRDIQQTIGDMIKLTENNIRITVIFALNYGGREEIVRAVNNLQFYKSANLQMPVKISEAEFTQYLDTAGISDPELIIRTGGEERLSGFLLWQCQYSELYFPKFYMPDFTPERLDEAVSEYNRRQRRFGK